MLPPAGWRSPLHCYNPVRIFCPLLDDALHYTVITRSSPFPAPPLWSVSVLRAFLPSKRKEISVPKLSLCVETGTNRKMWIISKRISRRALMTDQADRPLTPLSSLEQLSRKDSRGNHSTWVGQMERKGPVRARPFPIVGIYGHVVLFQLSCWLLSLTGLYFSISLYVLFQSPLAAHACLLSVSIIYMSLHIFRYFAVITPLSWQ